MDQDLDYVDMFDEEAINFIDSPFNYMGGKFKLMPQMKGHFPKHIDTFVDMFCGGGSVFVNSLDVGADCYIANDSVESLMAFYGLIQDVEWDKLLESIRSRNLEKADKDAFEDLRDRYNTSRDPIDFYMLICCGTLNMIRFNKQKMEYNNTWGNRNFNFSIESKLRDYHRRIFGNKNIWFMNTSFLDFDLSVLKGQNVFVYLDPPYWITKAGYNMIWTQKEEEGLHDFIDSLEESGIKFMMSNVAEHNGQTYPYLDRLEKYRIVELDFDYNSVSRSGKSKTKEIIVMNYGVEDERAS